MLKSYTLLVTLCACLLLAACGGAPAPERFLRLQATHATCATEDNGQPVISLTRLDSLPGMERTNVLFAHNAVLAPSTLWYWEGTPAELLGQALGYGLSCDGRARIIWPDRLRATSDGQIAGRVLAFEVQKPTSSHPATFRVAVHLELFAVHSRGDLQLVTAKTFDVHTPITTELSAEAIAQAASQATTQLLQQADPWLANHVGTL